MSQVTIKAMINEEKTKVVFAEANSEFTDILFSFLMLPLGKIAKLPEDHRVVGSLCNLYRSVANLDSRFFINEAAKLMLLNPRTLFEDVCPNFRLDNDTKPIKYFTCNGSYCHRGTTGQNICMYYGSGSICTCCGRPLSQEMTILGSREGEGLGFTVNTASFFISDDLRVEPSATGFLQTLRNFDIADTKGAEMRNVTFGFEEIIGLLRCCLFSKTPLTDLILDKSQKPPFVAEQSNPKIPFKTEKTEDGNSNEMILKITLQKSTNKFLFAQAEADFVEVLFSFLTIPLGGVESLLGNITCCKNLNNVHRSLSALDAKYFTAPDLKSRLMNPKLAPGYSSRKQFLPLSEETAPTFYTFNKTLYHKKTYSDCSLVQSLKTPIGLDNYVKEPTTFMVTDDLTVTPFVMTSGLSILDRLNIPLDDIDELEVHIGMEEVLGILRASITSACALSTALSGGLNDHMPNKRPKLEH